MVEFYQVLSEYYDEIFPLKEPQKNFLRGYLSREDIKSVLDVGCATGSYVLELSNWGYSAFGVDLSQEMIEIARQKAWQQKSMAKFMMANMLDLEDVPGQFDGILCLGNTLAHLTQEAQLKQAIEQFGLKGKHLLVQVVNYDRVLAKKITELPEIRTSGLVFRRYYKHLPDGLINFSMEIDLLAQGKKHKATNTLAPLTRDKITRNFAVAGWKPVSWWGSYASEEWSENSQATIVAAKFGCEKSNQAEAF